jgi:hypothetical protein
MLARSSAPAARRAAPRPAITCDSAPVFGSDAPVDPGFEAPVVGGAVADVSVAEGVVSDVVLVEEVLEDEEVLEEAEVLEDEEVLVEVLLEVEVVVVVVGSGRLTTSRIAAWPGCMVRSVIGSELAVSSVQPGVGCSVSV